MVITETKQSTGFDQEVKPGPHTMIYMDTARMITRVVGHFV